ncbi:helix-turn-helix domain-containing protein [Lysinibacillus sp. NPDC059133]|uniref:helix-turn-helix domain-containing protein n=1 Tax=Lysinibacillus sp. NPDC059133 TaxID=3346737 RepID=UPI003685F4CD
MDTFSKRLKACREKKKSSNPLWTQSYAADKIGVARTTYTAYENGTKTPPLDTVNLIADLFEVSTDYLLGRTDTTALTAQEKDEAAFQAFANDPELNVFYKELPESDEEAVRKLRNIWEIIKNEKK